MLVQGWALFLDTENTGWKGWLWRVFTHKNFRHVIVVQKNEYNGNNYYTFLDPSMGWLSIRPLLGFKDEDITEFGEVFGYDVKHIVPITAFPDRDLTFRGLYSCVGVVKQMLGITNYTVVTPRGLYRLLTKINKELLWDS